MHVKKFYAMSIDAAMRDVRRTLGADALILSTRSVRNSGIVVNGGPARVEVTASRSDARDLETNAATATTPSNGTSPLSSVPRASSPALRSVLAEIESLRGRLDGIEAASPVASRSGNARHASLSWAMTKDSSPSALPLASSAPSRRDSEARIPHSAARPSSTLRLGPEGSPPKPSPVPQSESRLPSAAFPGLPRPRPNPYSLSRRTDCLDATPGDSPGLAESDPAAAIPARVLLDRLRSQGVEETLVSRIVERMYFQGSTCQLPAPDSTTDREAVSLGAGLFPGPYSLQDFSKAIRDFVPPLQKPVNGTNGVPRKIALIGPTGVGKTTTIAKIASLASLRYNLRVALVTLDTLRIAAADQLRTYAKLLGVPIEILADPSRMRQTFDRFADTDLILIDTPGYSPRDRESVERLARALGVPASGVEVHLVLTATQRGEEMRRTIERFRSTGFDRLIFSKIDETGSWGDVLNTWILAGYGVSYFTTGQRVPDDLETATVDGLCRRLADPNAEEREQSHEPCRENR